MVDAVHDRMADGMLGTEAFGRTGRVPSARTHTHTEGSSWSTHASERPVCGSAAWLWDA